MNYKKVVLEKLCSMGFEPTLVGDIGYVFNYEEVNFLYMPDDDDDNNKKHILRASCGFKCIISFDP